MANELEMMIDQTRIIETINELFIGTDNRDWALVKSCFASSVLFDMSSLGAGDPQKMAPDEIVAAWDAGLKPLKAIHHQAGNYIVRVSGIKAEAFCYGIASHYLPNKTNVNTRTFVGSYDFELLKTAGKWRISKFKFNLKYLDGNPNLESS
ncbi:MAG: nuclear transport factor 2 family protein [Betaproteobacteria bacterium]|nr:nuclear transport factor 2 family protein [Betaproteobacteria bacterium]